MKALITGASSGIGKNMAYVLANKGIDLILVARNKEEMLKIKENVKVNVLVIELNLLKEKNVFKLYEMCKDENIDILINNAGFGLFGIFTEADLTRELEMIDLNIKAYHILTKLFLKDFVEKDKGYILNVASSAGFMAGPRLSTYYATKNYVLKLTMAINEELRQSGSNVVVSALCPGPVNTNFNKVAMGEFSIKEASPKYVAEYAIDKMFKKKMIIVPTLRIKLGIFLLRLIPYRLQLIYCYHIQGKKLGIKKK
ncbi:kR domain protein [Firmicutes bacterium CAG:460]|jgi:short-chain dehydrogenases of various substrate specificities|uniref:SDR family NAD(P)-dependent oxidoreductase n=1 Tax=Candidatus Onthocola sp. TaxID=3085646 RepID=UPI000339D4A9|nr:SDR family NAD(P)-dependent oxidoreductase [Bacillota bacterium]CDE49690.1 kR domain protein [Firmicutes bacterium CAG:460]